MLSFFLRYLQQKCGRYICVQLLQTLNILFENIRNETSLCKYLIKFEPVHEISNNVVYATSKASDQPAHCAYAQSGQSLC